MKHDAILDFALRAQRHRARTAALELERQVKAKALAGPTEDPVLAAIRALNSPSGIAVGHLLAGPPLRLPVERLFASGVVAGASGSGKTYFTVHLVDQILRLAFSFGISSSTPLAAAELEICDPKSETHQLVQMAVAKLYAEANEELRELIASSVRVVGWSRERISPFCPYDNDGSVSDSYHADFRSEISSTASGSEDSAGVRSLRFMVDWLLTALRFPPNYAFLRRLLADPAFRARIVDAIPDRDLREYFLELEQHLPRQTAAALLRRVQRELAFPEVKLALGIPPDALRSVMPRIRPRVVLADFGPGGALPRSVCLERASHHVLDTLRRSPLRDASRPKVLVIEETPTLLAGAKVLTEPLAEAGRMLRASGVSVWYLAQDFVEGVRALARTVELNAEWVAVFRSRKDEAEWLVGHTAEETDGAERRAFLKRIEDLPKRHFYLRLKATPALPLVTDDIALPDPKSERGLELRELFNRKIAPRSTISATVAAELIEAWEARVVRAPGPAGTAKRGGIRDLLRRLGDDDVAE